AAGDKLFYVAGFTGVLTNYNLELWKSDGTSAGTALVYNINPDGTKSSEPNSPLNVGGTLFFTADDGSNGSALWKSDGTKAGTVLVKDTLPAGNGASPYDLTDVGGTLFFVADDGSNGPGLWKSDGTESGTVLVKDGNSFGYGAYPFPEDLTNVNGTL